MPDPFDQYAKAPATAEADPFDALDRRAAAAPKPQRHVLEPNGELAPDDGTAHFGTIMPRDEEPLSPADRANAAAALETMGYTFGSEAEIPTTRGQVRKMREAGARAEFARHARVPHLAQDYAAAHTDPETQRQIEAKNEQYRANEKAAHEQEVEDLPYRKAAFMQGVGVPLEWLGASDEQKRLIAEGQAKHPVSTFLASNAGMVLPFSAALKGAKALKVADWIAPTVAGAATGAGQAAAAGGSAGQIVEAGLEGGAFVTGLGVAGAGIKAQRIGMAKDRAIAAVNEQRSVLSEARDASRELDASLAPGRETADLSRLPRLMEEARAKAEAPAPSAPVEPVAAPSPEGRPVVAAEPPKVDLTGTPDKFHSAAESVRKSGDDVLDGLEAETVGPKPAELSTLPAVFEAKQAEATGGLTSIKNRIVNAERAERGVDPLPDATYRPHPKVLTEAREAIAADPGAPETLAREVAKNPRPLTDTDVFLLDMRRVDLNKARRAHDAAYVKAMDEGNVGAAATAKAKGLEVSDSLLELEAASQAGGTKSAQGLAARIRMMREDYSLGNMETQARKAGSGERLTSVESAQVKGLHEEINKIRAERDAYQARLAEREAGKAVEEIARPSSRQPPIPRKSPEFGKANKIVTREAFEKALAEFKGTTLSAGIDPTKIAAAVKIGAFYAEGGIRTFASWAKAMTEELGDEIAPHLKTLWASAQRELSGKTIEDVAARIKAGVAEGKALDQMPGDVGRIAEMFVRQGITERGPLIDAVHGELSKIVPGLTKSETHRAISGYGKQKALDADPVKVELRELKGQMLQIAKLEDMAAGKAPARTGLERQSPADAQRALIRLVNEAKKAGGFDTPAPETALKSALDSVKTRLRNSITDLERQIAAKVKDAPPGKIAYDAEAAALKQQRDALREQYVEVFGKPELTNRQRIEAAIKATERSIAESERRLAAGDVFPAQAETGPSNPRLDALRAKRDELQAQIADMRGAFTQRKSGVEAQIRAVEKSIAEYERRVKAGDVFPAAREAKSADPRVEALRARRDELRQQVSDLRAAATPRASDHDVALKALKTRKQNRIKELEDQMARGEVDPKKAKRTVKPDAELVDINAREAMTLEKWQRFLFDKKMANRSRAQVAADTALQTAQTARAVMTSLDLSAPLRQGLFYVAARPGKSRHAFAEMFRALKSPEAQARSEAAMRMDPDFTAAKRSGVFFNETGGVSITKMEEEFMSRWAENIPGVAGSQRAYTTFLNKARLDYFKTLTAAFKDGPVATPAEMRAIASFVNVATGRGGPMGAGAGFLAGANYVLFSPRLLLSRLQILSGAPLIKGALASKRAAKIIAKEYARFLGGVGVMYGAALSAKAAGLDIDVTFDPRSTDFGKLRFGHTRLDPLGGLAQVVRLGGNTATGEKVRADGRVVDLVDSKKRSEENLGDVWGRFLRSKLAPIPGAVWSAATKKDVIGNRTNWGRELSGLVIPMSLGGKDLLSTGSRDASPKMEFVTGSDVYQAMKEHGVPAGAAMWIGSLFGMGLQHYENHRTRK